MWGLVSWLDGYLYRGPFEGRSARRYAQDLRPGFGDLDIRLIRRCHEELARARTALDVGSGPGTFATLLGAAYPDLQVVTVEPSTTYAGAASSLRVRACAEALPLAAGSVDFAMCLSSMRHVDDREAAFRELRRVCSPTGVAYVVELDPVASRARARQHRQRVRSWTSRLSFEPLVLRTAPTARAMAALATRAGWRCTSAEADEAQPVYILRLVP